MEQLIILFSAGMLGGIVNAIAGGGGIILYPGLLASGLSPLIANATLSLVVWPGNITSAYGYRKELRKVPKSYYLLLIPCFIGSIIGSVILVRTNPHTFEKLAPWLVLSAVVLLATQSRIQHWLSRQSKKRKIHWRAMPFIYAGVFPLAIYGGFFGVGFGLMMLALLGFSKLQNIHQMNGVKNLCGIVMSLVATAYFSHAGIIDYSAGAIMAIGTSVGGITGAKIAHRVPQHLAHNLTVVIGFIVALILVIQS